MNSILYFLDPRTELNDRMFRYATLRSYLLPEIQGLKNSNPELDIKIVMSKSIYEKAKQNNLNLDDIECFIIDEDIFEDDNVLNDKNISIALYHNNLPKEINSSLIKIFKDVIPDGYAPDVIISYESPAPFWKDIFPDALLLNSMFGIFSRAPFPAYGLLDPCGLYEYSYQYKYADRIRNEEVNEEERKVVKLLQNQSVTALATYHPLKKYLSRIYERFERLVVLACQVDSYFSYNGCTNYKSQFEMVADVLSRTPENIGVIVTEHGYKRQISKEQCDYLYGLYNNFIYFSESSIPTPTQFLLPYVDGALSVSSSIGYQAALWKIPYLGLGLSQIDLFATHENLDEFYKSVRFGEKYDRDNIIYVLLSQIHISHKNILFNGDEYLKKINDIFTVFKNGNDEYDYFSARKSVEEVTKDVVSGNREWLLKKTFIDSKLSPEVDHLRVSMSRNRAISFDLFDTLVERDFVEPYELFSLIEYRVRTYLNNKNIPFAYIRRQAEIDLRRESKGEFEITLDQIYERFIRYFDFSLEQLEYIKNIEIEAEVELVHPKKEMVREFYFSQLICESVSIITDIYLPQEIIERILIKAKITGYNKLLVSAETKTRKHNGTIYPEYLRYLRNNFSIIPGEALHVGDNSKADGDMAKKNGMRAYVFPKAMENYKKSMIGDVLRSSLNNSGLSSSVINGIFANKYHAGHWFKIDKESIFNAQEYNYGYMAIGPLVVGFTQWLHRRAKKLGINKLYFLARDGWVLKKAFDELYPTDESGVTTKYLYSSRRAAMVASIRTVDDIVEVASQNFNARKLSEFLSSRFGLNVEELDQDKLNKYRFKCDSIVSPYFEFGKLISFLKDIKDEIFISSEKERADYTDYLRSTGFELDCIEGGTAVVDIGYSGSMQYYLKRILQCRNMNGFYFLTHHHSREYFMEDHFEGFLQDLDDHKIAYRHGLNDHVFIFEAALSSPEGSLIKVNGVSDKRQLIFLEAEEEAVRRNALLRTHYGVIEFVQDIKRRFGSYYKDIEFSSILSSQVILNFANHPNGKDAGMFAAHEVENVFGGGSVCLISPIINSYKDSKGKIDPKIIDELLKTSKWKKGAEAYYKFITGEVQHRTSSVISSDVTAKIPQANITPKGTKDFVRTSKQRKLSKFRKDPYLFCSDSKKPIVRTLRFLFKNKNKGVPH